VIVIAQPYARFTVTLPGSELERSAANLLQVADQACKDYFAQRYEQLEITVATRVEIGSTRTWTTIKGMIAALLLYGGVRQSVDYLVKDGDTVGQLILPRVANSIGLQSSQPERQERRLGIPGELRRLFVRVERGEMTAEEATSRALYLLRAAEDPDTARELPRLTQQLVSEFERAARRQEAQLSVDLQPSGTGQMPAGKGAQPPQLPDLPLPPETPTRRRRGVVATKDRRTGHVTISRY
jgi:hypothetical protein